MWGRHFSSTALSSYSFFTSRLVKASVGEGSSGGFSDAHEYGGDEAPHQLVESEEQSRGDFAGRQGCDGRERGPQRRPQTPRRMAAVEVQDVRKPVFELPLDGVIKREEAVTREMPFLVKPDCPRIGAA